MPVRGIACYSYYSGKQKGGATRQPFNRFKYLFKNWTLSTLFYFLCFFFSFLFFSNQTTLECNYLEIYREEGWTDTINACNSFFHLLTVGFIILHSLTVSYSSYLYFFLCDCQAISHSHGPQYDNDFEIFWHLFHIYFSSSFLHEHISSGVTT